MPNRPPVLCPLRVLARSWPEAGWILANPGKDLAGSCRGTSNGQSAKQQPGTIHADSLPASGTEESHWWDVVGWRRYGLRLYQAGFGP